MTSLVLLEAEGASIKKASRSAIAAAQQFGAVTALLIGKNGLEDASRLKGITALLHAPDVPPLAEDIALLLAELADNYTHVLAAATAYGKNILPRAAGILDVQPVTEIVEIINDSTFVRPIYAGSALATVRSNDRIKLLTIRASLFEPVGHLEEASLSATRVEPKERFTGATLVGQDITCSARPELDTARVIISGGRGLRDAENFKLLEPIATLLDAAIGASRAAVDSGFAPNELQVGQTGKIVAPELYVAVGLSGAIQHLAGIKDSRVIVAINVDPDAPIFSVADYGLVGDLFDILPKLHQELNDLLKSA